jgi:hypothetical protein
MEIQHGFAEIAPDPPDAIMVADIGELIPYRQLIVELVEKSRLPAMYGLREFVEAGGLMAYEADFGEAARRIADDVHEILNGANPGDIPIYQPTKYQLVINLKAANALGLTLPNLQRHSRAPQSRVSAEKISVRVAVGGRFQVVGHVGKADLAQLVDHHVAGQLSALGPLRPGLLDRRGDVKFCQVLVADLPRRFGAVAGPDGRLRRTQPPLAPRARRRARRSCR